MFKVLLSSIRCFLGRSIKGKNKSEGSLPWALLMHCLCFAPGPQLSHTLLDNLIHMPMVEVKKENWLQQKKWEGSTQGKGGLYKNHKFLRSLQSRQGVSLPLMNKNKDCLGFWISLSSIIYYHQPCQARPRSNFFSPLWRIPEKLVHKHLIPPTRPGPVAIFSPLK